MSWLWHSFADMGSLPSEIVITRGDGSWVWDANDRKYLDAIASLWYCNIGHGNPEVVEAAARQMRQLEAYQTFGSFANGPAIELAERLNELVPMPDAAVFFTNGGSDAIDTAGKLVRRYWNAVGQPDRQIIVVHERAYHGMNAFGTSLAGLEIWSEGYGPLIESVVRVPHDDPEVFRTLLRTHGDKVAAFLAEPVMGGGGIYPPAAGYWREIASLCREHDVLLVADEVITGFGRLGEWFGSDRFGIDPDIMTCAKGITSGYIPLGAVVCGKRVREPFWSGGAVFQHGYTYAAHPTACAVALANLAVIDRESLVPRVHDLEATFTGALKSLETHPLVGDVRAIGLMAGVELTASALAEDHALGHKVVASALERGVILRALGGRVLQVSPPFIITTDEIGFLVEAIMTALDQHMHVATRPRAGQAIG
jgi:putrescine---pyruvate transaminase